MICTSRENKNISSMSLLEQTPSDQGITSWGRAKQNQSHTIMQHSLRRQMVQKRGVREVFSRDRTSPGVPEGPGGSLCTLLLVVSIFIEPQFIGLGSTSLWSRAVCWS